MTRLADGPPRSETRSDPSPRHLFNREPLLIPQLFTDNRPWYRRRANVLALAFAPPVLLLVAFMISNQHWLKVLKKFAHLFH